MAEAVASGKFGVLSVRMQVLCEYALRLTHAPEECCEDDVRRLRASGLDDRAIVDANQVVAYFNYVNRIALGLGVQIEKEWPESLRAPRHYRLSERR